MRGAPQVGDGLLVGHGGQRELEHADRLAAIGHRREHAHPVGSVLDLDALAGQRPALRRVGDRHPLGGLAPARARRVVAAGVLEAHEGVAAEVGDQERHLGGPERLGQPPREHVGGVDRRRVLDGLEQLREIERSRPVIPHPATVRRRGRGPSRYSPGAVCVRVEPPCSRRMTSTGPRRLPMARST